MQISLLFSLIFVTDQQSIELDNAPALMMPLTLCQVKCPAFCLQDTESEERQFMLEAESSKLSLSLYLNQLSALFFATVFTIC